MCALSVTAARPSFRHGAALGISALILLATARAPAQVPVGAARKVESAQSDPHQHFNRALELYRAGRYSGALDELEQAAALDPNGKDLFFNLALVHEKLGQLPQAIAALERFRELETDRRELERASLTIERLRGAQHAGESSPARQPEGEPCSRPRPPAPTPLRSPNPVLVGAASIAAVSFVVGAVFGLKALSDDAKNDKTSDELPVDRLRERRRRAEREALVADVAFAIGAASAATFVGVWLLSPREPARGAGVTLRGYF